MKLDRGLVERAWDAWGRRRRPTLTLVLTAGRKLKERKDKRARLRSRALQLRLGSTKSSMSDMKRYDGSRPGVIF